MTPHRRRVEGAKPVRSISGDPGEGLIEVWAVPRGDVFLLLFDVVDGQIRLRPSQVDRLVDALVEANESRST